MAGAAEGRGAKPGERQAKVTFRDSLFAFISSSLPAEPIGLAACATHN